MKAFKTLPRDMSAAYDDVIERIENSSGGNDKDIAFRVLAWIFLSLRPLTMDELLEALAVGAEDDSSDEEDSELANVEEDIQDIDWHQDNPNVLSYAKLRPDQVVDCCKSLIQYDETSGLVRPIHYTLQEYYTRYLQSKLPSEGYLAKTCLLYLRMKCFQGLSFLDENLVMNKVDQLYKFRRYALDFWVVHTQAAEEEWRVQKAVLMFLATSNSRTTCLHEHKSGKRACHFVGRQTPLHVAALNGLASTCRLLLQGPANV
jgi:hypothetical protein